MGLDRKGVKIYPFVRKNLRWKMEVQGPRDASAVAPSLKFHIYVW